MLDPSPPRRGTMDWPLGLTAHDLKHGRPLVSDLGQMIKSSNPDISRARREGRGRRAAATDSATAPLGGTLFTAETRIRKGKMREETREKERSERETEEGHGGTSTCTTVRARPKPPQRERTGWRAERPNPPHTPHRPHAAFGPSIDRTPPHRLRATVMPEKPLQHDPGLGRLRTGKRYL